MANDATSVDYRRLLEDERATLRAQLAEFGVGDGAENVIFDANFADTSQVTAERGELETLVGQLGDSLAEVDNAIDKLDRGEYGTCEVCGQPISEARLEAMPATRFCIDDAKAH